MTIKSPSEEELEEACLVASEQARKYYLGLWNLLKNDEAPPSVIINESINNMLTVLDFYMTGEQKLEMLQTVLNNQKVEDSLEQERKQ